MVVSPDLLGILSTVILSGPIKVRHVTTDSLLCKRSSLPYIRAGAANGDMENHNWSTHAHRGGNPHKILIFHFMKVGSHDIEFNFDLSNIGRWI